LAAETGVAVFKVAFKAWIDDASPRPFTDHVRSTFDAMRGLARQRSGQNVGRRGNFARKVRR
jgi:hypothetical protein